MSSRATVNLPNPDSGWRIATVMDVDLRVRPHVCQEAHCSLICIMPYAEHPSVVLP